jgi:hypothetical protein
MGNHKEGKLLLALPVSSVDLFNLGQAVTALHSMRTIKIFTAMLSRWRDDGSELCFQGSEAVVKKKQAQHQTEKMKENDLL